MNFKQNFKSTDRVDIRHFLKRVISGLHGQPGTTRSGAPWEMFYGPRPGSSVIGRPGTTVFQFFSDGPRMSSRQIRSSHFFAWVLMYCVCWLNFKQNPSWLELPSVILYHTRPRISTSLVLLDLGQYESDSCTPRIMNYDKSSRANHDIKIYAKMPFGLNFKHNSFVWRSALTCMIMAWPDFWTLFHFSTVSWSLDPCWVVLKRTE